MVLVVPQMATLSAVTGRREHAALPMVIVAIQRLTVAVDVKADPALVLPSTLSLHHLRYHLRVRLPEVQALAALILPWPRTLAQVETAMSTLTPRPIHSKSHAPSIT